MENQIGLSPLRKPPWLWKSAALTPAAMETAAIIRRLALETVCAEAGCPNRNDCFSRKRTAFLAMGPVCTRRCAFCLVASGTPAPLDPDEPDRIAGAAAALDLAHVVVTSVTRDDLADGGAAHFSRIVAAVKSRLPAAIVEVLVPDFSGRRDSIRVLAAAGADVVNHNLETVPRLYRTVRPQADYRRSLELLSSVKQAARAVKTKSGLMVGLGEKDDEIHSVLKDLKGAGCDLVTIGQYLAPSRHHFPVTEYIEPAAFERYRDIGQALGFASVASGPFVRSSYHADTEYLAVRKR